MKLEWHLKRNAGLEPELLISGQRSHKRAPIMNVVTF